MPERSQRIKVNNKKSGKVNFNQKYDRFKLLGSDISVLANFVESVTSENVDEIVTAFITAGNVMQIFGFLDNGQDRKPRELLAVFKALYIIIMKTSRDLSSHFPNLARELAEGFLEDSRLSLCLKTMWKSQNAEVLKTSLQLLGSVVTVSEDLARAVLRHIDFDGETMKKCSWRRNLVDKCDVRTCFINFLASFVYLDSNLVLRELVDKKGALNLLINESFIDKFSNVMLILNVLMKIAENSSVSKTQRVRVFNRLCLQKLASLYLWRGEGKTIDEVLRRDNSEVNEHELASIRDSVHKLLIHLFTPGRFGLVFSNKFDSNMQYNSLVLQCLTSAHMDNAYTDPLRAELVTVALCKCPELFPHYLDHLAPTLYPRDSPRWFCLVEFIFHIYKSISKHIIQFTIAALNQSLTVEAVASAIANLCTLSPKMVDPIRKALQCDSSSNVRNKAIELMGCLKQSLKIPLTWLSINHLPSTLNFTSDQLKANIELCIRERLPDSKWLVRFQKLSKKSLNNPVILMDQIVSSVNQNEPEETFEQPMKIEDIMNSTEQSLNNLPEEVKKIFRHFETPIPDDCNVLSTDFIDAINELPQVTEMCFKYYSNYPVVYRYLAKFIHFLYNNTSLTVLYKPKLFFKLLLRHVNLPAILFTNTTVQHQTLGAKVSSISDDYLLKEYLFKFLLEIAYVSPKTICKHIPVVWLLSTYNATLSSFDRTILKLLYHMEKYSPELLIQCRFIVWGDIVCKHYQLDSQSNTFNYPTLLHQPTINALFIALDDTQMLDSAYNFPLYRKWSAISNSCVSNSEVVEINRTYDPCFILHVLYYYLKWFSEEYEQNNSSDIIKPIQFLKAFYVKNCLCYSMAGLSSYSKHLRNMARTIIAMYRKLLGSYISDRSTTFSDHNHSQGRSNLSFKHFPEGQQIAFLLDTLRNSLSRGGGSVLGGGSRKAKSFHIFMDSGGRLTKLHANFFIRVLKLFSQPENHMFQLVWNCLLAKPAIDLRYVPEFLRLFFSTNNKFTLERQWICRLCVDSLDDPADYLVMENSLVFKHILCAYSLPSAETSFKLLVLRLLVNATKHSRIVHALIRFHSIPLWLSRHAASTSSTEHMKLFLCILENIYNALEEKSSNQPTLDIIHLLREECSAKLNTMNLDAITTIPFES
ncbi:hypothetical protein MN116_001814 [Schistosoma mekongi]|uniref:Nucleolar pre-ribosomal-associated protein 1 n=1 Tax=Schistosoma mekongi TaxID=38744 RepID=A0AAE2D820_SCHME|nr:hypothetical protein MN116_001814 [Schistosoma mekongi]